ncbi:hypothetical protein HOK68_03855 [Candidatus Woesearchaeota archaeon]|jgi:hypothetical protein|nr:hypothetical protein [Candidatus Woesearchaeota archaeon]MBT4387889.1 hypothetical protein [Candidatus Woesearchaeota archaeon]MBT4595708.1 hypothetical protein [Candidatus Woesearchaeota archaeon]MBT5741443.1 hypothetical protein [Candidatus Woesearchaeota archaeon]MBT6505884.1 hypothetical protein [Candidatus Woesearchaeota archaeon]
MAHLYAYFMRPEIKELHNQAPGIFTSITDENRDKKAEYLQACEDIGVIPGRRLNIHLGNNLHFSRVNMDPSSFVMSYELRSTLGDLTDDDGKKILSKGRPVISYSRIVLDRVDIREVREQLKQIPDLKYYEDIIYSLGHEQLLWAESVNDFFRGNIIPKVLDSGFKLEDHQFSKCGDNIFIGIPWSNYNPRDNLRK